jgi:hypothetical protein
MRLCLLMHGRYPPYSKWLGTAVARLPDSAGLTASLTAAVSAGGWPAREQRLREAYETVAALREAITDPEVRRLPPTSAIDQFIDSTDALGDLRLLRTCVAAA